MRIQITRYLTGTAIAILIGGLTVMAQATGETFTATATVKSPTASASTAVTIRVDKFVSDADRDRIMATIKAGDGAATRAALAAMPDIGFIEMAKRRTPVKYAYARPTGAGRLITVVTAQPILFLGGAAPDAKPKAGFDLALALLILDGNNAGDGELAPAAKVKMNETGAIVTDEYGSEVIRLTGIAKAK
jgi:hypothetical protein